MLARYDRYILGKLMVTFGFFTLIIVMVYWINRTIRLFDRLIGDGESMSVFLQLTALTLPYLIMIMLPLSSFAASVSTGATSEMSARSRASAIADRMVTSWCERGRSRVECELRSRSSPKRMTAS